MSGNAVEKVLWQISDALQSDVDEPPAGDEPMPEWITGIGFAELKLAARSGGMTR